MSDKPKSKDLLTSGSGLDFFGAHAYVSQTPTNASASSGASVALNGVDSNGAAAPKVRKKKPVPKGSPRSNSGLNLNGSNRSNAGGANSNSSSSNISSDLTAAAGERWVHRHIGQRMVGDGVGLSQMRTVRADGALVVQHRGCRLTKPSADDDSVARLLRDDDTVVADFKLSQLQRVVLGAKTPTMQRAVAYSAKPQSDDDDEKMSGHKWEEIKGSIPEGKCLTIIYGNQYLDFEVTDEVKEVTASGLAQWLVWVAVLAAMNVPEAEPDDESFGGIITAASPRARSSRRGSSGVEEASETLARFFMPAAEYCRLPGAPVERVSVASEGMASTSTAWVATHCAALTCHGAELCRSSNPDMTIQPKHNQDAAFTCWPLGNDPNIALSGVFDGHGDSGHRCSHYCMRRVCEYVANRVSELPKQPTSSTSSINNSSSSSGGGAAGALLTAAFLHADQQLGERHPAWADAGGTTACVVLMVGKQLTIANCGDSRWVLGRRRDTKSPLEFKDLSVDQNPDDPAEKARVHRMGGWVGKEEDSSEVRVWIDKSMSSAGLSMARSLGDHTFKPVGVIAEPVITEHLVRTKDEVLVGASDGVWSVLSSAKVMQLVDDVQQRSGTGELHASRAASDLVSAAARRWKEDEGDYRDDISAIVVKLPLLDGSSDGSSNSSNSAPLSDQGMAHAAAAKSNNSNSEDEAARLIRLRIDAAKQSGGGSSSSSSDILGSATNTTTTTPGVDLDAPSGPATPGKKLSLKERRESEKSPRASSSSSGGGATANCSGGHGLKQYTTPRDNMICSGGGGGCGKTLVQGAPFFGCKPCKATWCETCYRNPPNTQSGSFFGSSIYVDSSSAETTAAAAATPVAVATCKGGHGLKNYNAPNDNLVCDRCKNKLQKGNPFHGCKACKCRLCPGCFKKGGVV